MPWCKGLEIKVEVRAFKKTTRARFESPLGQKEISPFVCNAPCMSKARAKRIPVAISEGSHPFPSRTR